MRRYILVRAKASENLKVAVGKLVLELLLPFLVLFTPALGWPIDNSNQVWQLVRWGLPRVPVTKIWGHETYVTIFYILMGLIYGMLVGVAVLTLAMRKQEHSRWLRKFGAALQFMTDLLFGVLFVAVFDFLVFFFDCDFGNKTRQHMHWTEKSEWLHPHL
ncbi:hypothetical protein PLESTF_001566900 [Pleodorina starrii]|nr:hypothetical protein PLESTF_001566900 [Pleodorina starrii]